MYTYFSKKERTILRYMVTSHKWNLMSKEAENDEQARKQLQRLKTYDAILKKLEKADGGK